MLEMNASGTQRENTLSISFCNSCFCEGVDVKNKEICSNSANSSQDRRFRSNSIATQRHYIKNKCIDTLSW